MAAVTKKGVKRIITPHDKLVARKAKSLYNAKKKQLGLNQTILANQMHMSQSALNQYLNCFIPMNMTVISQLADAFGVAATEIDKKFEARFLLRRKNAEKSVVPVIGTTGGNPPSKAVLEVEVALNSSTYAVQVDEDAYKGIYKKGAIVCADALTPIRPRDPVLVRFTGMSEFYIMELLSVGSKNAKLAGLMSATRANSENNPWFGEHAALPVDAVKFPLETIISMHKVVLASN